MLMLKSCNMKTILLLFFFACSVMAKAQNIGIGTNTPTHGKLEVVSASGNTIVTRTSATGVGVALYNVSGAPSIGFNSMLSGGYNFLGAGYGSFFQYTPTDGKLRYYSSTANGAANAAMVSTTATLFSINPNGDFGIGSIDPQYQLDVNGRVRIRHSGSTAGVWFNKSDNTEGAFLGQYNDNVIGMWGPGTSSTWKFGFDLPNIRLGINTMTPLEGVHMVNRNIRLDDASSNKSIVFNPNGNANAGMISLFDDTGSETVSIRGSDGTNQSGEIIFRKPGSVSTTLELDGDYASSGRSRIIVDEIQIKGGADFAEYFDVKNNLTEPEAGMLVSIDELEEGKMTISSMAYDKKVAGVISGANGIKAGMMMGHKGTVADGKLPIAISGRVYVKAEAINGSIRPGDLLTTSATPGYAMKAKNYKKSTGAIIGKAMGTLDDGKTGFVLVLLNIQ